MAKERILAKINGKDVCDDWVYEEVFSDGWMCTPYHRKRINDVIGFYHGCLLSAHWIDDGSIFEFNFIDYPCALASGTVIKEFVDYLNGMNDNDTTELKCYVETTNNTYIKVAFYWKNNN